MTIGLEQALPEKRATRRAFDRVRGFDSASFIHDAARDRLLERLDLVSLDPRTIVDLGCATGRGAAALAARYPAAHVLAVDSSMGMLRATTARAVPGVMAVAGEAERLPLPAYSVELLFANLVLPWCRPDFVFAEAARVLGPDGVFVFATLGPDSLAELRRAFGAVDNAIHVHAAFDVHDLGDLALKAGLAEPVLDVDRLAVTYAEPAALWRDLKAVAASNVAGGRRRALTGPRRWSRFLAGLAPRKDERFGVTVELIFGQAFGRGEVSSRRRAGSVTEVAVPISRIRRASETT
ncbi:MAG TPA: methyltransferase domain-containing protein [Gammaproteobacteria bacterium]|nr:methyltransferase domain-containing protein [Gammaproteobacteria bacterium]